MTTYTTTTPADQLVDLPRHLAFDLRGTTYVWENPPILVVLAAFAVLLPVAIAACLVRWVVLLVQVFCE